MRNPAPSMSSRGKAPPVADSAKASTAKGVQVLPDDVYKYLMDHTREADVLRRLREATTGTSGAEMQAREMTASLNASFSLANYAFFVNPRGHCRSHRSKELSSHSSWN